MNPGARLGWILVCCTNVLVEGAAPLASVPDLLPVEILSVTQSVAGAQIAVDYAVTNQGNGPASADWYDQLYLSADAILDASDYSLGTWLEEEDLAAGTSYRRGYSVMLPAAVGGTYYLILWTDKGNSVFESDELNNRILVQQLEIIAPDLVPVAMEVRGGDGGQAIEVSVTVTNQGLWNAVSQAAVWNDGLFISTNGLWDTTDTLLKLELVAEVVLAGTSYRRTSTVTLPAWVGNFYLIYKADFHGNVIENNETNNELAVPITPRFPDLRPLALTAPSTAVGGRHLTTVMLVTNEGNASATSPYGSWADGVYLSTDAVLDAQDLQISHPTSTRLIPTNTSYFVTNTTFLPPETGVFYLIGKADHEGRVTELDEADNQLAVPITIVVPDLVAMAMSGPPPTAVPGQSIQLSYSVTNQGNALANPNWYDEVVFSDDPVWDWWDRRLDSSVREVGLDPGGGYRATNTVTLPATMISLELPTYYLIVRANAGGGLAEQNWENNSLVWPLQMKFSDLVPTQLIAPAAVVAATPVQVVYAVTNRGNGMAIGPWYDSLFLSTNNVWDPADRLLTFWFLNMDVAANTRYAITNSIFFPPWPIGEYYLFLRTDSFDELLEADELNNTSSAIPISLVLPQRLPDLVPIALTAPSQGEVGTQINVSWTVANTGDEPTQLPWEDGLYLSANNSVWDEDDIFLTGWTNYQRLVVNDSNVVSRSVLLPRITASSYYLVLRVDQTAFIYETNEQNNQRSVAINLTSPPVAPNLVCWAKPAASYPAAKQMLITYAVTNVGNAIPPPGWDDAVYLSRDIDWDESDYVLGLWRTVQILHPGEGYSASDNVFFPAWPSGLYYMIVRTDLNAVLDESDRSDNFSAAVPVLLTTPDLSPVEVAVQMTTGGQFTISYAVTNQGDGIAVPIWRDELYLSDDAFFSRDDDLLGTLPQYENVPAGGIYRQTNVVNLGAWNGNTSYLFLSVNSGGFLWESNGSNNIITALFSVPSLEIHRQESSVLISWPSALLGHELQSTEDLHSSTQWTVVTNEAALIGNRFIVTMQAEDTSRFFRLSTRLHEPAKD